MGDPLLLTEYTAYLTTRRRAQSTIRLQVGHIRRMTAELPDPFCATGTDLEAYLARHPHWAPSTVNSVTCSLRSFYRWAHRFGYITDDPTKYLQNVPIIDRMGRIVADCDVIAALKAATPEHRAIILLGRLLGLRRSEIASLRCENRDGEWLHVTGKGGRTRRLRLEPLMLDALLAIEHDGYYFPGRFGGHRSSQSVYAIIRRLVHTNPHSLRHAAATAVYDGLNGDIRATQVFLGHQSIETTQRYVHVNDGALIRASHAASLSLAA